MNRLKAFWKETWWVWIVFALFGIIMSWWIHLSFLTVFPISMVAFVYFMFMRYDEEGNCKGDL